MILPRDPGCVITGLTPTPESGASAQPAGACRHHACNSRADNDPELYVEATKPVAWRRPGFWGPFEQPTPHNPPVMVPGAILGPLRDLSVRLLEERDQARADHAKAAASWQAAEVERLRLHRLNRELEGERAEWRYAARKSIGAALLLALTTLAWLVWSSGS